MIRRTFAQLCVSDRSSELFSVPRAGSTGRSSAGAVWYHARRMAAKRLSFLALTATLTGAFGLWFTAGSIAASAADRHAPRIGVLPSIWWLAGAVLAAVALAAAARRARAVAPLLLAATRRAPLAAVCCTVGISRVDRAALHLAMGRCRSPRLFCPAFVRIRQSRGAACVSDPRRAPALAAALAAAVYLAAAWAVSPRLPAGDEPHYLVITQSLLLDHDLKIENNHRQGDYHAYYGGDLRPDYLQRGKDREIYSIHAPGLSIAVAPAFALFGYPGRRCFSVSAERRRDRRHVERGVADDGRGGGELVRLGVHRLVGAVLFAIVHRVSGRARRGNRDGRRRHDDRRHGRDRPTPFRRPAPAWPHCPGCTPVSRSPQPCSPCSSSRETATAIDTSAARRRSSRYPIVSAFAWFGFFFAIYGTADPRAPYGGYTQSAVANLAHGIPGLLFDQQFGLLPNAPAYLCVLAGAWVVARRAPRLALELAALTIPYGLAVAAFFMWWGGFSSPARFLTPIVLPLAIPAGVWFQSTGRGGRVLGLSALFLSVTISATLVSVDRGALLYNGRDGASNLLVWLSPAINLAGGLPSMFQAGAARALVIAAIWAGAVGAVIACTLGGGAAPSANCAGRGRVGRTRCDGGADHRVAGQRRRAAGAGARRAGGPRDI